MRRLRTASASALALLVIGSATACDSSDPEIEPPSPYSVSYQWDSTDPTTDLDADPIRVIRATIESDDIDLDIGRQYAYPGYVEAIGPYGTVSGGQWRDSPGRRVGTLHASIVVREISDTAIDAVVCRDETDLTHEIAGHYPLPSVGRSGALWALSVSARRANEGDSGPSQTSEARMPARTPDMPDIPGPDGRLQRPTENVFGDWHITEFRDDYSYETRSMCFPWVEQRWGGVNPPAPTRTDAEPPPTEPFYPGW